VPPKVTPEDLQRHISGTYHGLRYGLGTLAVVLPPALWLGGKFLAGEPMRCSMSSYYNLPETRDWFVGALVAIGALLYLYKGFSKIENRVLNLAGLCAVLIALVPTAPGCLPTTFSAHGAISLVFFVCVGYVAAFRASDTLALIRDAKRAARFRMWYRIFGAGMVVSPIVAVALSRFLDRADAKIFLTELVATWTFAAYWITKSREMKLTDAERLAAEQKLQFDDAAPPTGLKPGRIVQTAPDDGDRSGGS
jgi:hypothetical protein